MRAARLHPNANSLSVEDISDPILRPGAALVRIEAAFVSPFTGHIVDGSRGYLTPPRPFTPGMDAIGRVEAVSSSVHSLSAGDLVFCDGYYEPDPLAYPPRRAFIGNFVGAPHSIPLLEEWPDGVYADKVCLPAECLVRIVPAPPFRPEILCRLGWLGTAYAGLRRLNIPPGAVVGINGASGLLGSSAVITALALGASKVYAIGRREEPLRAIASVDNRVEAVTDASSLPPIDIALSSVDGDAIASVEAVLAKVKRRGGLVIVGAPDAPLSVPVRWLMANEIAIRGSYWFDHPHVIEMLRLAASGQMDLSCFDAQVFPLDRVNEALQAAHHRDNPLRHVAVSWTRGEQS